MSPLCFNIYEMNKDKEIDENHHKYFDGATGNSNTHHLKSFLKCTETISTNKFIHKACNK